MKLIAALTKHHKYTNGSCLNLEPIGNNVLAGLADVNQATASAFFRQQFGAHGKYKAACREKTTLIAALRLLNGQVRPADLPGLSPDSLDPEHRSDRRRKPKGSDLRQNHD